MKTFYLALSLAATRFALRYLGAALAGSALTCGLYGLASQQAK